MASRAGQSWYNASDLSSDDEKYLIPRNVAKTMCGWCDCPSLVLTATRHYSNSPPKLTHNWLQTYPIHNDYDSDTTWISHIWWTPDITDWWLQQQQTLSKCGDISVMACDILSDIPHHIVLKAILFLGADMVGWWQSHPAGGTLRKIVVVRLFARAYNRRVVSYNPVLNTRNADDDLEMHCESEEKKLHRMGNLHNGLEMLQGSQNLCVAQKDARP